MNNPLSLKKGLISVVFPIYGNFDVERLLVSLDSIRNQKGVDLEIVVSEQGEFPRVRDKLDASVKYLFREHVPKTDVSDFNPGRIRNDAILASSGEFVYTNDSDIVFLKESFLAKSRKLLESDGDLVLYRPLMRRLPIENFLEFRDRVNKLGISAALETLNMQNEFLATTDDTIRDLKVVAKSSEEYVKVFTTSMENFAKYLADVSLRGKEPLIWSENLHCGGNFFRREHFEQVGRYCEQFVNWGCEDSDLQWKFRGMFNLQFFPKIVDYAVMHLDHQKGYFSPEMWKRNEEICAKRRKAGIDLAILEDKRK